MRPDTIRLVVGVYEFTECVSMEFVSDLYKPSGSFSLVLGQRITARRGERCIILINDQLELTGIIDRVEEFMDDKSHVWNVSGRSLIGLIEDTYVTSWTNPPKTLKAAADRYLKNIPFVQELDWAIDGEDPVREHARLEVGDTVFKLLNEFAQNRGLLFWATPAGQIVFGKAAGKGEATYNLGSKDIKQRRRMEDCTNLHSEIWIVSDSDGGHQVVVTKNPSAPVSKPFAAAYNGHDASGLTKQAEQYLRQEKIQSYQLEYLVRGFSQIGKNWTINKLVQVEDDAFGISETLLIARRVFRYDIQSGSTTSLTLSPILAEDVFKPYPKKRKKETQKW